MKPEIRVIDVKELREDFEKHWMPYFAEELIKRTDKRYFTRNQIYIALIGALFTVSTTIIGIMATYPQIVPNVIKPLKESAISSSIKAEMEG